MAGLPRPEPQDTDEHRKERDGNWLAISRRASGAVADAALRRPLLLLNCKYPARGTAHAPDLELAFTLGLVELDLKGFRSSALICSPQATYKQH